MIDIIFGILNLAIFLALISYAVKKYVVPQLREKIMREHHDFVNMHDEHRELLQEQKHIEESIVAQEDRAKTLFKKINLWRNTVDLEKEAHLVDHEHLQEDARVKIRKQGERYALHTRYKEVAPLVVKKLEKELGERFADPKEGHAYIDTLLKNLGNP